jgi:putative ABC transport system permease protein
MNTMYGLVSSRTREIGTLRALGFSRASVMMAFMIESAFLASVAGLVGCVLALPVNLMSGATGGANFSEVAFAFRISPLWLVIAIIAAMLMGVVGGMFPSLRAARTPITAALRDA